MINPHDAGLFKAADITEAIFRRQFTELTQKIDDQIKLLVQTGDITTSPTGYVSLAPMEFIVLSRQIARLRDEAVKAYGAAGWDVSATSDTAKIYLNMGATSKK